MKMDTQRILEIFLGAKMTEEESKHIDEMARQLEQERLAYLEARERRFERTIPTVNTWGDPERYEARD